VDHGGDADAEIDTQLDVLQDPIGVVHSGASSVRSRES
jgi:hypothetical protein